MKLTSELLSSKVGRRIFGLFMLAAVLPAVTIALVSYGHIRQQISNGVDRQLHAESRALGLNVYDRLLVLEAALEMTAAHELDRQSASIPGREAWLESLFDGVVVYADGAAGPVVAGEPVPLPALDAPQREHLVEGHTVAAMYEDAAGTHLALVRALSDTEPERRLIVARPRDSHLWNFGVYLPTLACALTDGGRPLACSSEVSAADLEQLASAPEREGGVRTWHYNGAQYTVKPWDLFLEARFKSPDLSIVLALPVERAFLQFNSFKSIFPRALLLTALIVVALSIMLIRKYLDPLEKLTLATRRIRDGKFDSPVDVRSGDEFETLASSFNQMSERIADQFATLEVMSKIDRLILSALDLDHIIHTLMGYLRTFTGTGHIAVIALDRDNRMKGTAYFSTDPEFTVMQTAPVHPSNAEHIELEVTSRYLRLDESMDRSYIACLRGMGDRHFVIVPMREKVQPIGLICIGDVAPLKLSEEKLGKLYEIANRVAVALVNRESEERLVHQAQYDALTGLPNRYLLKDRLDQALSRSRRMESSLAVMFVDLDRFKAVNDSLGHAVGDEMLVQVAERLTSCVRGYDTLARFGGDEFIIVAEEEGQQGIVESASMLSRRLLELFKRPFQIGERELYTSASIGVAVFPRDAGSADELIRSADAAMYQAKAGGRNAVCFFHRDLNARLINQVEMAADLRHAIARGQFSLVYQPKVARLTGRVAGTEALLRWTHPERGPVPPGEFIPVAEEAGLIGEIGAWVLREACTQARAWRSLGIERFHVAVNVSGAQFRQPDFCDTVRRTIAETGVSPGELELEITESITIEDSEKSIGILDQLHATGVRISIDDFGTGYSSLSYLQQFRVHRLKVDRVFIQADPSKSSTRSIVRAIVALGHGLGLSITAEGVETKEQMDFVTECGCDEVQGYHVSRPLTVEAFQDFARGTHSGVTGAAAWAIARDAAGSG